MTRGVPTPEQIAWHEMEIEMFLCLDPCTWQENGEIDDHSTPLSEINPEQLDTDQWCRVAKSFGAKQILFVAKHVGGFCWWQTDTTEYSIKNTPYKGGKGDVLAELSESCRKHGLKLGVYIYPGDAQWGAGVGSGGKTDDPAKQDAYTKVLRQQWTEVLTRYGEVSEVWFDGSCVIELGDILEKYVPKAMVFQGPHATLRWPGNEEGIAPYPTWQTVKKADAITGVSTGVNSDPDGDVWLPMEMDTTLLKLRWFWAPHTDALIKPLDKLMEIYYKSVGRGCVLLLDATPDTTGLIPESHVSRYVEFGEAIANLYKNLKGETAGRGRELQIDFDAPTAVTHVVSMEDIQYGQIVRAYEIDGLIDGQWKRLAEGVSVGYKRIDVIPSTTVEGLRLRVTEAVDEPVFKQFAAYEVEGEITANTEDVAEPWTDVPDWQLIELTSEWLKLEADLTAHIRTPGQYEVELVRTDGEGELQTKNAIVLVGDTPARRLITEMDRPGQWILRRTDQVIDDPTGRTTLQVPIRCLPGGQWTGRLRIRRL